MALAGAGASGGGDGAPRGKSLEHLTGFASLVTLWVVLSHFTKDPHATSTLDSFLERVNYMMLYFGMVAGFSSHCTSADLTITTPAQLLRFWRSRLDRPLLTIWFGYLVIFPCLWLNPHGAFFDVSGYPYNSPGWYLLCFASGSLNDSLLSAGSCPNLPAWFVGAIIPSWLAYPLIARGLRTLAPHGARGYAALAATCWVVAWGPFLIAQAFAHPVPEGTAKLFSSSPLAFFFAFTMGCAVSQIVTLHAADAVRPFGDGSPMVEKLAEHYGSQRAFVRGLLGDVAMLLVLGLLWFADADGLNALGGGTPDNAANPFGKGYNALSRGFFLPLFALFLYGSSAEGGSGLLARFFAHPVFVSLGKYNLQVYLLQYPWGFVFGRNPTDMSKSVNCAFIISLYVFAALYTTYLEEPLVAWLRTQSCSCGARPAKGKGAAP